jgi:alkanesulfonate monooxygenase SsuD/methylene tetrahydromethanopterin reductase-like flavin-dependent oxidoreductase (luciferase family)
MVPADAAGPELDEARGIIEAAARDAGRDPAALGLEGRVAYTGDPDAVAADIEDWRAAGATHVSVNTMSAGLPSADAHLKVLTEIASAAGLPAR